MPRNPELQTSYYGNSIPLSAKCSICGERMPQSTPRIMNPMDNVEWFAAQFRLHVSEIHPDTIAIKLAGRGFGQP
jgi:hypothetical protein